MVTVLSSSVWKRANSVHVFAYVQCNIVSIAVDAFAPLHDDSVYVYSLIQYYTHALAQGMVLYSLSH